MPSLPASAPRHGWLEALRGIAALQVFLLHLLGAFWLPAVTGEGAPGLATWLARSPLALLYEGESAVALFFLLSGAVLAQAFQRQLDMPAAALAARVLRLGLPAALACLLAFVTFHLFPGAHGAAAARLGASWLDGNWAGDGSLASLLWEAGPGLLLGFIPALPPLPGIASAYNGPLWTIAVELRGSALVLGLLLLRRRWPAAWGWAAAAALAGLWRSEYAGFLIGALGSLAAPRLQAGMPAGWRAPLALGAGLAGAGLNWLALRGAPDLLPPPGGWIPCLSPADLLRALAALLGFAAVAAAPALRHWLERPWLGWLGRLSFPLYLVHWPMILGPGAAGFLLLEPLAGPTGARLGGMAVASLLSLLLALAFRPVDGLAMRWSRQLRAALAARPGALPAAAACAALPRV